MKRSMKTRPRLAVASALAVQSCAGQPAFAQVPDAATLQAAKGYVDPLLQLGAVGVICLVLILAAFFLARALIACMNTSRESAAANATVIANNTAKAEAAARELDALKDEFRSLKDAVMWRQNAAPHP